MTKALNIVPDRCTGCMQCELACSWVQTGTFAPSRSLIRVSVFDEEASYAPYTCLQCDEAWCMNACPVNAIAIDPATGAKVVIDGSVHRLPPVHDRLSVRHRVHAAAVRQGREVQPVRRAAGVRRRVPDAGDRVRRVVAGGAMARGVGCEGPSQPRRRLRRLTRAKPRGRPRHAIPKERTMQRLTGKLLRVDLTSGRIAVEDIRSDWLRDYLGGRGLAARYLYEELDPRVDPLSPANKLIFADRTADRHAGALRRPLHGGDQGRADQRHHHVELRRPLGPGAAASPATTW